jgi:hypothetical protein
MKYVLPFVALLSVSAFADTAELTSNAAGIQTLELNGRVVHRRDGEQISGATQELVRLFMRANQVLSVRTHVEGGEFDGKFLSGYTTCPGATCSVRLVIEQRKRSGSVASKAHSIVELPGDTFVITGPAAEEMFESLVDAGAPYDDRSGGPIDSRMSISGQYFSCSAIMPGVGHTCTVSLQGMGPQL